MMQGLNQAPMAVTIKNPEDQQKMRVVGRLAADVLDIDKAQWGAFAYWMTALSELIDMRATDLHLDIDNRPYDLQVYGLVIAIMLQGAM